MPTILVVEDDISLGQTIRKVLNEADYQSLIAHTAEEGLAQVADFEPDLILLDVMVPNMGGWELCKQLRQHTAVPIIFLTALTDTQDIVYGLQLGADDYITKPFNNAEFLARIEAHLRRHHKDQPDTKLIFGNGEIQINLESRKTIIRQKQIEFTPREYSLWAVLIQNAGKVLTTEDLLTQAWGEEYADVKTNIKPYIHYLRKKVEKDSADPHWIITVRGIGYRFNDDTT